MFDNLKAVEKGDYYRKTLEQERASRIQVDKQVINLLSDIRNRYDIKLNGYMAKNKNKSNKQNKASNEQTNDWGTTTNNNDDVNKNDDVGKSDDWNTEPATNTGGGWGTEPTTSKGDDWGAEPTASKSDDWGAEPSNEQTNDWGTTTNNNDDAGKGDDWNTEPATNTGGGWGTEPTTSKGDDWGAEQTTGNEHTNDWGTTTNKNDDINKNDDWNTESAANKGAESGKNDGWNSTANKNDKKSKNQKKAKSPKQDNSKSESNKKEPEINKKESEVNKKESENHKKEPEIKSDNAKQNSEKKENVENKTSNDSSSKEFSEMKSQLWTAKLDLRLLERDKAKLNDEIAAVKTERDNLVKKLALASQDQDTLKMKVRGLTIDLIAANEEIQKLNKRIDELESDRRRELNEVNLSETKRRSMENKYRSYQQQIADLESELGFLKDEKEEDTKRIAELEKRNERLEADLKHSHRLCRTLREGCEMVESQVKTYEVRHDTIVMSRADIERELIAIKEESSRHITTINKLQKSNESISKAFIISVEEHDKLKKEIEILRHEYSRKLEICELENFKLAEANGQLRKLVDHMQKKRPIMVDTTNSTTIIKEGKATLQVPKTVFYNPVQEFNRDLSVLVLRTYLKHNVWHFKNEEKHIKGRGGMRILDALSASGLRSIRYAKELGQSGDIIKNIVANDLSQTAVDLIKKNIESNDVGNKVSSSLSDAITIMHLSSTSFDERFHVIDLDPFGTGAQFFDAAVHSIGEAGLLMVTCTDTAVLCGNASESCFARYGSMSLRADFCHEMALRIILRSIESHAAVYGRYIKPLLSISVDFYVRLFIQVFTKPAETKKSASKLSQVYLCKECKTPELNPIGSHQLKDDPKHAKSLNDTVKYKYKPSEVIISDRCKICLQGKYTLGGPIWSDAIHDTKFLDLLKQELDLPETQQDFATFRRIKGMVHMCSEELPVPLFYTIDGISSTLRIKMPPRSDILSALVNAGYQVSSTHTNKCGFKTNAPSHIVWDIFCQAADQHGPRRQDPLADRIMMRSRNQDYDFKHNPLIETISQKQSLLRFQMNPTRGWGPMTRPLSKNCEDSKNEEQLEEDLALKTTETSVKRRKVEGETDENISS